MLNATQSKLKTPNQINKSILSICKSRGDHLTLLLLVWCVFLTPSSSTCDQNKCKQKELGLAAFPIHCFSLKNIHIRRYLVVNIVSRGVAELVLFNWTWSGLYYLRKWWASVGFFAPVLRVSSRAARNSFVLGESAGVQLGWPWRCFGSEKLILLTKWLNVRSSLEQFCRTKKSVCKSSLAS